MEFNSLFFMFIWLPLFVFAMLITGKNKYHKLVLLIFSLLFYFFSDVKSFLLLVAVIILTYQFGLSVRGNRRLYTVYLILLVAYLALFKYGNFLAAHLRSFVQEKSFSALIMPLGISFYVFTSISYVSDCYRETIEPEKDMSALACYLSFFPTIISGPIHRYRDFRVYLNNHVTNSDTIADGLRRFILGLGKKTIIANQMAIVVNKAFAPNARLSFPLVWLGFVALMMQMYYDFSAYSDMAIGIAKMVGYQIPENFDHPYLAVSFNDFWRRWHISLSRWFRDYVYIPLGGSRTDTVSWIRNMLIVWILTGIWHGSTFNFLLWGLYNGLILMAERKLVKYRSPVLGWFVSMIIVAFGWLIFKTTSIDQLLAYLWAMVGKGEAIDMLYIRSLDIIPLIPFILLAGLLLFVPLVKINEETKRRFVAVYDLFLIAVLSVSLIFIISGSYSAFIYFAF